MASTAYPANAFGDAVRRRLREMGRSQSWLADELGGLSPQAVSEFLRKGPPRERAFQIEDLLGMPGQLAPLAGFTRPGVERDLPTLAEVLAADQRLTDRDRAAILSLYDVLTRGVS
jgi:hypothetical protein